MSKCSESGGSYPGNCENDVMNGLGNFTAGNGANDD